MKTFIVAIPLFDKDMSVLAYRLCDRNAGKLLGTANDYQELGEALLSPGLNLVNSIGLEPFTGDKPLFVDLNQYLLLIGTPTATSLPPDKVVCVLPADIPLDRPILEKCARLQELGYTLAVNGLPVQASQKPLMSMVSYVLLDYRNQEYYAHLKAMTPYLHSKKAVIINVPDMAAFNKVYAIPNALFAGNFYNQPITINPGPINPLKVNALNLLNQVSQDDFELSEIAKVVERDPSIAIDLLRFINSPAVGISQRISSIRNAVAVLGQKEMKKWVNVAVSVALAKDRPDEITKLSLVRAKFAENLATAYELGVLAPSLFMAGLFSLLDVILELPMEEAVKAVALDERVRLALVERRGSLFEVLDVIYNYERGNWTMVSINMVRNNVEPDTLSNAFIDALIWYKELLTEIDEGAEE